LEGWGRAGVKTVVADAGYDSEDNHRSARLDMGVRSIIPPRIGRPSSSPPSGHYRRLMKRRFKSGADAEIYGQRSQSEASNSVMKRNLMLGPAKSEGRDRAGVTPFGGGVFAGVGVRGRAFMGSGGWVGGRISARENAGLGERSHVLLGRCWAAEAAARGLGVSRRNRVDGNAVSGGTGSCNRRQNEVCVIPTTAGSAEHGASPECGDLPDELVACLGSRREKYLDEIPES
jgi:hypothetical protein